MKKLISLVLAWVVIFALSGCGGGGDDDNNSPVKSVNIADLENGYGVEFEDVEGELYIAFGCGKYVAYDEGVKVDSGNFEVVDTLVETESTINVGESRSLETDASTSGVLQVGRTYEVTDNTSSFNVEVTWIQIDNQTCP